MRWGSIVPSSPYHPPSNLAPSSSRCGQFSASIDTSTECICRSGQTKVINMTWKHSSPWYSVDLFVNVVTTSDFLILKQHFEAPCQGRIIFHSKLWFALVNAGNTSQMGFFYFGGWLVLRDIAYSIMICKCFQILCLLLLLNFQQLLVYIFGFTLKAYCFTHLS